jgi:hypothetical protein
LFGVLCESLALVWDCWVWLVFVLGFLFGFLVTFKFNFVLILFNSQNYSLAGLDCWLGAERKRTYWGMRGQMLSALSPTPDPPNFDATLDGFRTQNTRMLKKLI